MVDYLKKPWFTGIQAGFQVEFTTSLLLLRESALICRLESCKPQYQHSIEGINENWIWHRHGVSLSHNRKSRNAAFLYPHVTREKPKEPCYKRLCGRVFAGDKDLYLTPAKWRSIAQHTPSKRRSEAMAAFQENHNRICPILDYPMSENPIQLNKDILNTNLLNKEKRNTDIQKSLFWIWSKIEQKVCVWTFEPH